MIITNDTPPGFDVSIRNPPAIIFGTEAIDGTLAKFKQCPVGSIYVRTATAVGLWFRSGSSNATSDWINLIPATATSSTITGNLIVTGTLTAGDIVADPTPTS